MRVLLLSSLLRLAAGDDVLHRTLAERVTAGECSTEELEVNGNDTFFPAESRTVLQEEHPHFAIFYAQTFKVVVSKPVKEQYVLTQCGQTAPSEAEVESLAPLEAGYVRKSFDVPLQSYTAFRTEHYGFLNYLNVDDRVGHVISSVTEPCWQKAKGCNSGKIAFDATFHSDGGSGGNAVHIPIKQDLPPLRVAEYIHFFGPFFNKDAEANRLFANVKAAYETAGTGYSEQPTVAWIKWRRRLHGTGTFIVFDSLTKSNLVTAAGGKPFDTSTLDGLASFTKSAESVGSAYSVAVADFENKAKAAAFFFDALGVDVVIDETDVLKPSEYNFDSFLDKLSLENTSAYKFVANRRVLRVDGTISFLPRPTAPSWDWMESPSARPDLAAGGLARQLHSDDTKGFRYFRNIAKGEEPRLLTADMCEVKLPACGEGRPANLPLLGGNEEKPTEAPTVKPTEKPTEAPSSDFRWIAIVVVAILAVGGLLAGFFFVNRGGPVEGQGALGAELTQA